MGTEEADAAMSNDGPGLDVARSATADIDTAGIDTAGIDAADIDTASVDAALATTRSVRLRLDLERDVDVDAVLDCIDIAEQAPTGGNQGSRRWVIVRDRATKERLAELYYAAGGEFMVGARDRLAGTGHPQERVMKSAAFLAEHLADVPVIVIPTIIGEHDGSGRPGLFDSVIQSVWSFCVAARARGLGTAWTTAVLAQREPLAELLDLPAGQTPIAMIPVAWTSGTFRRAPRYPARAISFFDSYGVQWESGPSDPPRVADGPGTTVEIDIDATRRPVWDVITDIGLSARFSEENVGAEWVEPHDGPALGAQFVGHNEHPVIGRFSVPCFVTEFRDREAFGWVTSDPDRPGARWRFELASIAGATRLRYSVVLGPGPSGLTSVIDGAPERAAEIIVGRVRALRANMQSVIEGVRELAENSE